MLEFGLLMFAIAVESYFLGCSNGAVIISKFILKDDIRTHGSGNAGLTNFHRVFGGKLTAAVLLMDMVKMALAVWLGTVIIRGASLAAALEGVRLLGAPLLLREGDGALLLLAKYWAGMWCIIGHMYPCMFGFKGGKGILSGGTLLLLMGDWRIILVGWGGFLLLVALTRWVSLGSIWAGASFPFSTCLCYKDLTLTIMAIVVGGLIVWKHRGNLSRILKGTESKFSLHHKSE